MAETKHTPGPWLADESVIGWRNGEILACRVTYEVKAGHRSPVALCPEARVGAAQAVANARLMAAAPNLLRALKLVLEEGRFDFGEGDACDIALRLASQAIDMAEGR